MTDSESFMTNVSYGIARARIQGEDAAVAWLP